MGTRSIIIVIIGLLSLALHGCGERAVDAVTTAPPAAPTTPTTPPQTTPVQRTCPVCGQPVPVEAKYCRKCGSRLH